jgi:hypothetical protein
MKTIFCVTAEIERSSSSAGKHRSQIDSVSPGHFADALQWTLRCLRDSGGALSHTKKGCIAGACSSAQREIEDQNFQLPTALGFLLTKKSKKSSKKSLDVFLPAGLKRVSRSQNMILQFRKSEFKREQHQNEKAN